MPLRTCGKHSTYAFLEWPTSTSHAFHPKSSTSQNSATTWGPSNQTHDLKGILLSWRSILQMYEEPCSSLQAQIPGGISGVCRSVFMFFPAKNWPKHKPFCRTLEIHSIILTGWIFSGSLYCWKLGLGEDLGGRFMYRSDQKHLTL